MKSKQMFEKLFTLIGVASLGYASGYVFGNSDSIVNSAEGNLVPMVVNKIPENNSGIVYYQSCLYEKDSTWIRCRELKYITSDENILLEQCIMEVGKIKECLRDYGFMNIILETPDDLEKYEWVLL